MSIAAELKSLIAQCMIADRPALLDLFDSIDHRHRRRESIDVHVARLRRDIEKSLALAEARRARIPALRYSEELPIAAARDEIKQAITEHQVVVIGGETGSGKTTQLPKLCMELGRGVTGAIGHTQPRRIAARSVAARIAAELGTELGAVVGYKIRFNDRTSPQTILRLMTDGILLAETAGDRDLLAYDTIIIDEAHERSLNIDFLLGYLKQLLPRRPDLKVIVTSATIDLARFSAHFGDAPILEVSGRTYPVTVYYREPPESRGNSESDPDLPSAVAAAAEELCALGEGDILVFLSGEREIRDTAEALGRLTARGVEILPLYSRLSTGEQDRIWQRGERRRIVLATNVAETSITVPGIRYVIDSGVARISRYGLRSKVQRLPIEAISQASAEQRKGRCGRMEAGICIRLYSEEDFAARPRFTDPEILRTNLASVILSMKALDLGEIANFPFVDPPDRRQIADGLRHLFELGAIDEDEELTEIGRMLARLPLDPGIGRMILAAAPEGALAEVLIIAAALAIPDPRERPADRREAADAAQSEWSDERSDFISFLKLWRAYRREEKSRSGNQLRKFCKERFLSYMRMREWSDVHLQLREQAHELGLKTHATPASYEAIHRALMTGLLGNLGVKQERGEYLGARGMRFSIFPGSALAAKKPAWIMAAEIVETSRLFARTCAVIDPAWVEPLAEHLLKRVVSDPYWDERAEHVAAIEKVTLFGLPIVAERRVHYGQIDAAVSRHIMLRALVDGTFQPRLRFFAHNRRLMAEIEKLEDRARRRDVLVDLQTIYDFYDLYMPHGITSGRELSEWVREREKTEPNVLCMTKNDLIRQGAAVIDEIEFPKQIQIGETKLTLVYRFEPGHPDDGVTMEVPLSCLNQISEARAEWLVPGLLLEKVTALLRALPKEIRRLLVPAPDIALRVVSGWTPTDARLLPALSARLREVTGVDVPADTWRTESLPPHLRMAFKLFDAKGNEVARARDLRQLQAEHGRGALAALAGLPGSSFERHGLIAWDFDSLPEKVVIPGEGLTLVGYPGLVDEGASVALVLLESVERAERATRGGLSRLFALENADLIAGLIRSVVGADLLAKQEGARRKAADLAADIVAAAIARALWQGSALPRTRTHWLMTARAIRERVGQDVADITVETTAVFADAARARAQVQGAGAPQRAHAHADIKEQLDMLLTPGYLRTTPPAWLAHFPRYLRGILARLEKLNYSPQKDEARTQEARQPLEGYRARAARLAERNLESTALTDFRFMIEEYRISLFAQELKTAYPVSKKRLEELWKSLGRG